MTEALRELTEKVRAGNAEKYAPEYERAFYPSHGMQAAYLAMDAYQGDLNAARDLQDMTLGAIDPQYGYLAGPKYARIVHPSGGTVCNANADNGARAWLICICRALSEAEG